MVSVADIVGKSDFLLEKQKCERLPYIENCTTSNVNIKLKPLDTLVHAAFEQDRQSP